MASSPLRHAPKVVLLCGGQGTRMREETEYRPKPMVEVGGRPLLWHIMKIYAAAGLTDFVCCLGYRGTMIKQYFLDYRALASDVSVNLASGDVEYHSAESEDWNVTLVDTGDDAMTGARVKRVAPSLGDGDSSCARTATALADIDVAALIDFHRSHGKLATLTGVHPPSRFGELVHDGGEVDQLRREARRRAALVSGGFFVFDRAGARPPRADSLRARARAARGPRPRRRADGLPSTTASGSAPTPCATWSSSADSGTAATPPGGSGTTGAPCAERRPPRR